MNTVLRFARRGALQRVRPRPMFSDAPDPPDVYRSISRVDGRWMFYALGPEARLLHWESPEEHESDEEVVARLMAMVYDVRDEPRPSTLALINADSLIAHGFSPSIHRLLSLPRLVR